MSQTSDSPPVVEIPSDETFDHTLQRLSAAIATAGMRVFARIDHAAGAAEVGMTMPPTVLLLYGHPRGGTPIMLDTPLAALDLPLRVLVRETRDGDVLVSFHPVAPMLRALGVAEQLARQLEPAQRLIASTLRRGS